MVTDAVLEVLPSDTERVRYLNLVDNLTRHADLLRGRPALDFGASWGTSAVALIRAGAGDVLGVEIDPKRVEQGQALLRQLGLEDRITLRHVESTSALDFRDGTFRFVLANGVLEHIPQPRDAYLREIWRLIGPGGHLMITETPNKWWPREQHTTGLLFNHWLPRRLAYLRAVRQKRYSKGLAEWASSGWRGMSFTEMVKPLRGYEVVNDFTRTRHRLFAAVGLPSSIIDPDPVWILKKK
jgi:ubiquinone/menaquinone biosynthesis C-methylase UbiE